EAPVSLAPTGAPLLPKLFLELSCPSRHTSNVLVGQLPQTRSSFWWKGDPMFARHRVFVLVMCVRDPVYADTGSLAFYPPLFPPWPVCRSTALISGCGH